MVGPLPPTHALPVRGKEWLLERAPNQLIRNECAALARRACAPACLSPTAGSATWLYTTNDRVDLNAWATQQQVSSASRYCGSVAVPYIARIGFAGLPTWIPTPCNAPQRLLCRRECPTWPLLAGLCTQLHSRQMVLFMCICLVSHVSCTGHTRTLAHC
jgi:hypothetical protein